LQQNCCYSFKTNSQHNNSPPPHTSHLQYDPLLSSLQIQLASTSQNSPKITKSNQKPCPLALPITNKRFSHPLCVSFQAPQPPLSAPLQREDPASVANLQRSRSHSFPLPWSSSTPNSYPLNQNRHQMSSARRERPPPRPLELLHTSAPRLCDLKCA
jgi:hypothetical protein